MFLFFPIFYPLIMVFTLQGPIIGGIASIEGILIFWSVLVGIYLFIPPMLIIGFLNMEESGSSILASLPILSRDQAKAKIILMSTIMGISLTLTSIILSLLTGSVLVLLLFLLTLPIAWIFLILMFEMKIRLFGQMKNKYILEELNKEYKILKWQIMMLSDLGLYLVILATGSILFFSFGIYTTILVLLIIGIIGLASLMFVFTRMFPKEEKMSTYETGGLLRNIPILGGAVLTVLYIIFIYIADLVLGLVLFPFQNILNLNEDYILLLFIDFFFQFGFLAILLFIIVPKGMKLPEMNDSFKDYSKKIHLSTSKPVGRNILVGVGSFTIFGIVVLIGAIILGNYVFDPLILFGNPNPFRLGWFLFIFMLIPGIWEEIAFRGVAIPMLTKKYRVRTSLVISSVIFGLAHSFNIIGYLIIGLDPLNILLSTAFQVTYTTLLGFAMGYMYIKTKSLLPSIILHFLIDSVGQILFNTFISDIFLAGIFLVCFLGLIPAILIIIFVKLTVKTEREYPFQK